MTTLPEAYLNRMKTQLGDEFPAFLQSFQAEKVSGLRVNTLKLSPEAFERISPFELSKVPWTSSGFYLENAEKPAKHPYYFAGLYYLQEPSAMLPAEALPVVPGDRVLDLCAAPGGKSTELAAKLHGTGILFANDVSFSRAQALLKNLELFGTENAVILAETPERLADRFPGYFDKILIDAPCSGEGMFRKDPAVVKSWIEHGNAFYEGLQKQILKAAYTLLKPGGLILYSTCTFAPSEDEEMIARFLEEHPAMEVLPFPVRDPGFVQGSNVSSPGGSSLTNAVRLYPHRLRGEGHFAVLLKKTGEETPAEPARGRNSAFSALPAEARDFLRPVLRNAENRTYEAVNGRICALPDGIPDLSGLRLLRKGLFTGEALKNRFEPSESLAMSLRDGDFENTARLDVDDPRVLKYLKGETLDLTDLPEVSDGWTLVSCGRFPLGFGKRTGGILKNKYLAGWRYQ